MCRCSQTLQCKMCKALPQGTVQGPMHVLQHCFVGKLQTCAEHETARIKCALRDVRAGSQSVPCS